jgi:hypothetical protein
MCDPTYRVQFVDDRGETAFTIPTDREDAIIRACSMRLRFIVQAIVDDVIGDIVVKLIKYVRKPDAIRAASSQGATRS